MYFISRNLLEKLKLKRSDLEHLTESGKIQKIRSQWIHLCSHAQDATDILEFTYYYHELIRQPYDRPNLNAYFESVDVHIPHTMFSLLQRDQIKQSYDTLLERFSALTTEEEKTEFAQRNANFINLAQSLKNSQAAFDYFFGHHLFLKSKEAWYGQFIHQWRIQTIQLFGIEGLDDFQYRHALATGELKTILAIEKLCSPIKIIVFLINSILLLMSTALNAFLNLHSALRLLLLFIPLHPIIVLTLQFLRLSPILMILGNPITHMVRPLCLYTQWSPNIIALLLMISGTTLGYAAVYTSLIANLLLVLPFIILGIAAHNIYQISLVLYKDEPEARSVFLISVLFFFLLIGGIRTYSNSTTPSDRVSSEASIRSAQQWQLALGAHAIITLLMFQSNTINSIDFYPLPNPHESFPQDTMSIAKNYCNTTHISYCFFKTPKDELALNTAPIEHSTRNTETIAPQSLAPR
ncbi:MAG: hypothetical protein CK423_08115 [Legionella sp.]|nr:MAG: hypothetical protein CK423_08115 [Legionella sp.]